jgi:hypothetical protein
MPITLWSQLIWLLMLALASFLVTWIFTDLFHLSQTAFIGVLAVVTGALMSGYLSWSHTDWGAFLSGIIALGASVVVIMVHHLGYREFRGRKLVFAVAGCAPLSLAYLLTMNPLAAGLGHSILHIGAVLRGIELPPHQEERGHAVSSMMLAH